MIAHYFNQSPACWVYCKHRRSLTSNKQGVAFPACTLICIMVSKGTDHMFIPGGANRGANSGEEDTIS